MRENELTGLPEPSGKRHAFVVDDEPQVRAFIAKALFGAGFIPQELCRVSEVEAALTLVRPEVIVLDLSLGGSDAVEMMRSLAESRFGGKILLISGHAQATLDEVRKIGQRRGLAMLEPLRKPFRLAELTGRLAQLDEPTDVAASGDTLDAALQHNWLELWYQPKIDLRKMEICGAEALIRLAHPEKGIIPPVAFLPEAGDPLYGPLTDFVVRRSLADWSTFAAWPSIGGNWNEKRLAINVPASILQGGNFVENVRRHLPAHPSFPGLIVEITEDEAIKDPNLAHEVAIQLKLYNIHVSIDDFGAGYSSLSRLSELPFAELKLDRSFVDGCSTDASKRAMCRSVVDLAHRFRLKAVAEGVETPEDLRTLISMGFDMAQGYLFAKPMRSEAFISMLVTGEKVSPNLNFG